MVTAAGGLPGETTKGWHVKTPHSFDCEFGFSCMGHEIVGGWGQAMAAPDGATPIVMVAEGSYMMMNSDIWSSVLSGHKMIVLVCDNGGYAVINRLQNFKGVPSFKNLIKDSRVKVPVPVDFAKHAESMGALARTVAGLADLGAALDWARRTDRTTVIAIATGAHAWVPGDAAWDVGVPEVSDREKINAARADEEDIRRRQCVGCAHAGEPGKLPNRTELSRRGNKGCLHRAGRQRPRFRHDGEAARPSWLPARFRRRGRAGSPAQSPLAMVRKGLVSNFKCNTRSPQGVGCCDGQTKQAPQQRGTWRDIRRA